MSDGKILIIAEKPSVAGDIARALGGMKKNKEFYENGEYIVSSAVGHLLEMFAPEKFEVKRGKWLLENLPVLPDYFDLRPIEKSKSRLRALEKLYKRNDVGEVINACDAGREGELIFHNLMRHLNAGKRPLKKPMRRLWLSSMTATAIRVGFENLRSEESVLSLRSAAVSRAEADWLVGINATRAMTALHSIAGGFSLTPVGRVQTPTLALIVGRENAINAFVSEDYWGVIATFRAEAGEYEGRFINPAAKKQPERIFDKSLAEKVVSESEGRQGEAEEKTKTSSESAPAFFDLTTLQREANGRFHLPARATLAAAQALYERYKLITYPRTDSKVLPEDYPPEVNKILNALSTQSQMGEFAQKILAEKWMQPANKRIFNNAKVSDHFAIIPTGVTAKTALPEREAKIYELILRRFLAAFFPPTKYKMTERHTTVGEHVFETNGRILTDLGWRAAAGQMPKDTLLIPIKDKETVAVKALEIEAKKTTPPPRYNEATLLSAMEGAGKLVEDEELREAMRARGLGTPATRASIIEGLVRERYLLRKGRDLHPTPKAQSLVRLLRALKIEALILPETTGDWEYRLRQIEQNEKDRENFMQEIRKLTDNIVSAAKECGDVEKVSGDYITLKAPCVACGGEVAESHRRFSCKNCDFFIWKALANREFSIAEAEELLANQKTAEKLEGFRSKMGRDFSARLLLKKDDTDEKNGGWRLAFDFDNDGSGGVAPSSEGLATKESVGACPKCGAVVRDTGGRYLCEKNANETPLCDFSVSRKILQQEISSEQIKKMLAEGASDYLEGFISKKTGRPFKARLLMDLTAKDGKLIFEFAPRAAKRK